MSLPVLAAAQDATAPQVSSEAPALPDAPDTSATPGLSALPDVPVAPALGPSGSEPVSNDLMHLVRVAHPVVQGVMGILVLSGFVALTILIQKLGEYAMANRRLSRALALLVNAPDLPDPETVATQRGPGADMLRATVAELRLASEDPALLPGTGNRTSAGLERIKTAALQSLRLGTGILASIGALAPFVGLFGTVFGIMNSFLAIAETRTTNLSVVAPGIAEALLATALGLVAAIPAVLFYNLLARRLSNHRRRLDDLSTALEVLQSRALDRLAARNLARA